MSFFSFSSNFGGEKKKEANNLTVGRYVIR